MKRSLLLVLLLTFVSLGFAEAKNLSRMYRQRTMGDESLYFIYPQKGFSSKDLKKKKDFIYDVTYVSSGDSLTVNATYYNTEATPADSVAFIMADGTRKSVDSSILFVNKKKLWNHRISLKIPYSCFAAMYMESEPYRIQLYSKGKEYLFTIPVKKWDKQREPVNQIIELIEINRK